MGEYVIRYEKYGCIGAAVCEAVDPSNWLMNGQKADLIDGEFNEELGVWEKEITEVELEKAKQAAEGCPVRVIRIFDKKSGERIV